MKIVTFEFKKIMKNKKMRIYLPLTMLAIFFICFMVTFFIRLNPPSINKDKQLLYYQEQKEILILYLEHLPGDTINLSDGTTIIVPGDVIENKTQYRNLYFKYSYYCETDTLPEEYIDPENMMITDSNSKGGVFLLFISDYLIIPLGLLGIVAAVFLINHDFHTGYVKNLIQTKISLKKITASKFLFLFFATLTFFVLLSVFLIGVGSIYSLGEVIHQVSSTGEVIILNTMTLFIEKMIIVFLISILSMITAVSSYFLTKNLLISGLISSILLFFFFIIDLFLDSFQIWGILIICFFGLLLCNFFLSKIITKYDF